ncbi:hypothetical protein [Streptomyces sp. NPDC096153]|uniref:hypothetical protein n=1 Tax=Streptomyces sp. NPDC096153 TaxID=3155548 RepID=UPI00332F7F07
MLRDYLERDGYTVLEANDGPGTLDLAVSSPTSKPSPPRTPPPSPWNADRCP